MHQDIWKDPFTDQATKHGCDCCGTLVPTCYSVRFYILPTRLVRKRHRALAKVYCRSCYEIDRELPVLIDGKQVSLQKKGLNVEAQGLCCRRCGFPVLPAKGLYAVIASDLWMSGSCIKSIPLAMFCTECVEKADVALVATI